MNVTLLLADLAKCLVIFIIAFAAMLVTGLIQAKYRQKTGGGGEKFDLALAARRTLKDKKKFLFFSLIGLFFAIYAVKNIVLRLVFVLIYMAFFLRLYSDKSRTGEK